MNDAHAKNIYENGEQISASVTVQKTAQELYEIWASVSDLSNIFEGVGIERVSDKEIRVRSEEGKVEWTGEVLKEEVARRIAWRSVGDVTPPNAGSINLHELPFGRGTVVKVIIDYVPLQNKLGQALSQTKRADLKKRLQTTLFRMRQFVETGEVASTKGQPSGRQGGRDFEGSKDEKKVAAVMEKHL